jgi:hypothetical protein
MLVLSASQRTQLLDPTLYRGNGFSQLLRTGTVGPNNHFSDQGTIRHTEVMDVMEKYPPPSPSSREIV